MLRCISLRAHHHCHILIRRRLHRTDCLQLRDFLEHIYAEHQLAQDVENSMSQEPAYTNTYKNHVQ